MYYMFVSMCVFENCCVKYRYNTMIGVMCSYRCRVNGVSGGGLQIIMIEIMIIMIGLIEIMDNP